MVQFGVGTRVGGIRVLSDTAAGSVNWYNFQTLPIEG